MGAIVGQPLGRLIDDAEIKQQLASAKPYREWIEKTRYFLADLPTVEGGLQAMKESLLDSQQAFGYSQEDIKFILQPMATAGEEATGRVLVWPLDAPGGVALDTVATTIVTGPPGGLGALAVAAQVGGDDGARGGQRRRDAVPDRVRLRMAVQQQQRRPRAADDARDLDAVADVDAARLEAGKESRVGSGGRSGVRRRHAPHRKAAARARAVVSWRSPGRCGRGGAAAPARRGRRRLCRA